MTNTNISCIDVHQLKALMDSEDICLIDVRELEEWQEVRIPRAIHIPKGNLAEAIDAVAPNKDQAIYLHCRGGVRSLDAAATLLAMGYNRVYSVSGGIADWFKHGYETTQ